MPPAIPRQHGVKGVYYGGEWLDIEDCDGVFTNVSSCSGCDFETAAGTPCPRSRSRNAAANMNAGGRSVPLYDVVIVGAGCIGASIARELSKYHLRVLLVEAADDVSQGATKGNSGIVHAGYDDKPGSVRAQHCWKGNQMFAQLDKELRFGYQKNGSLVVAFSKNERHHLEQLKKRGETNGVQRLRIIEQQELRDMEPHIHPDAIAALYSPDAGNVIPYEYTIALAENAVDNGVELLLRRRVVGVENVNKDHLEVTMQYWEPGEYVGAISGFRSSAKIDLALLVTGAFVFFHYLLVRNGLLVESYGFVDGRPHMALLALIYMLRKVLNNQSYSIPFLTGRVSRKTPLPRLAKQAGRAVGDGGTEVSVDDMLVGGSGSATIMHGQTITKEVVRCRYVVNCAGGAADQIARLVGDESFKIKPRVGDYLLLNRNQGHLAKHTLFPCPDPVLGKGVLVQTTLWGNLILGPTARDMHQPEKRDLSPESVQEYILSKCKRLVPSFDPKETIHAFCGARAKSDRGDWIIEHSKTEKRMIHVAGIDSPGLAGAPSIALEVVKLLQRAGLKTISDPSFNPNRAPIITPKSGMRGLKMGPVGKFDGDGDDETRMAQNVVCKCEKVTELEVVRAMRRSLPIDSSQGIRKRTRAGMGHCQGDPDNYGCEARVRAIIARENGVSVSQVGARPWPATSTLSERWIGDKEKQQLLERMNA